MNISCPIFFRTVIHFSVSRATPSTSPMRPMIIPIFTSLTYHVFVGLVIHDHRTFLVDIHGSRSALRTPCRRVEQLTPTPRRSQGRSESRTWCATASEPPEFAKPVAHHHHKSAALADRSARKYVWLLNLRQRASQIRRINRPSLTATFMPSVRGRLASPAFRRDRRRSNVTPWFPGVVA